MNLNASTAEDDLSLQTSFKKGLGLLGIPWDETQIEKGVEFIRLIRKWNKVDNLTAITQLEPMVSHHLLDSLSILSELNNVARVLDVGSGAGLPGIPLALFMPDTKFILLDAAAKRVRFMHQAILLLGLQNVEVRKGQVSSFAANAGFDAIVSRAFTSIKAFTDQSSRLLVPGGRILAMKGRLPDDELSELPEEFEYTVIPLQVPNLQAQRHLISITAGP